MTSLADHFTPFPGLDATHRRMLDLTSLDAQGGWGGRERLATSRDQQRALMELAIGLGIDPARVTLPDGSPFAIGPETPPAFAWSGQSDTVSSSTDHAGARRVLHQAWLRVLSRPATLPELQAVQAIALYETGYGQFGWVPGSHNWGAVKCRGTDGAAECPAGCIPGQSPSAAARACWRSYPDDVAGAVDFVRNVTTARPRTMRALATGDADQIAAAMFAERYYVDEGAVKGSPVRLVASYANGIAKRAATIAKALGETPRVQRTGPAGRVSRIAQERPMVHLGDTMAAAVPLAALFGALALPPHFRIGDDGASNNPLSLPGGAVNDILPTFVTPDDARRYIRETDAQWERTDADIQAAAQVDPAFKQSWATDLESWRRFRDDAINTVGWLNTKATMQQTDRWGTKLVGWRKALLDAGGKLTGPGPVAPGQGAGGGSASGGWIQMALLVAALFGVGYLVRGFRA